MCNCAGRSLRSAHHKLVSNYCRQAKENFDPKKERENNAAQHEREGGMERSGCTFLSFALSPSADLAQFTRRIDPIEYYRRRFARPLLPYFCSRRRTTAVFLHIGGGGGEGKAGIVHFSVYHLSAWRSWAQHRVPDAYVHSSLSIRG